MNVARAQTGNRTDLSWFSIKRSMMIAGVVLLAGVTLSGVLSYISVSGNRIGGGKYQQLENATRFSGDFAPPPLVPLEAYTVLNFAQDAKPEQMDYYYNKLAELEQDYRRSWTHWKVDLVDNQVIPPALWQEMSSGIEQRAEAFWKAVDTEVIPAFKSGNPEAIEAKIHKLGDSFGE